MSTSWNDHWNDKRTMGAVLRDGQKTGRLEHSWLAYILAISGGMEDDVELGIVQPVGPDHTMRVTLDMAW